MNSEQTCFLCQSVLSPPSFLTCSHCGCALCLSCTQSLNESFKITCPNCKEVVDLPPNLREQLKSRPPVVSFTHLVDVRVIQRDLVYIVGIPIKYAHEDTLLKYEFFGQYGPIKKAVVNSNHVHLLPNQNLSVSAYITFRNYEDAIECIYSLENFILEGNQLKASFGTTKYCSFFLRGQKCTNPDCMYLHHSGEKSDSFSKDEITGSSSRFIDMTRPTRPSDYGDYMKQDKRPTILPPRRILKKTGVIKKIQQKENENSFLDSLSKNENQDPIIIEGHPNVSLISQLKLGAPSLRSIFNTLLEDNK